MSETMTKEVAGYHMLMVLSAVDGQFNHEEDRIIREYLDQNLNALRNLDSEMALINSLSPDDYPVHFNNAMNRYYMLSTPEERNHFLDLATRLVASDKKITPKENLFLGELFNAWEEDLED